MAKVKQDSSKPKQKKRILPAQLIGGEEVVVDCAAGREMPIDCGVDYRLFGLEKSSF